MNTSKILIVAICSNHKDQPGLGAYDVGQSLLGRLSAAAKDTLRSCRREAYSLLKGAAERDGVLVSEHDYNYALDGGGIDLGGGHLAYDYLPAVQRYTGRFYGSEGLGHGGDDQLELVRSSPHHLLIISGLYGLVAGSEYIQRYSLTLGDHPNIRRIWAGKGTVTELLVDYVRTYGIERVYELTGNEEYRSLVNWHRLSGQTGCEVLHAYSNRNAGPSALPALGRVARELLQSGELELLTRPADRVVTVAGERVILTASRVPPAGYPRGQFFVPPDGSDDYPEAERVEPVEVTTSGDHGTMFGRKVRSLEDLPGGARNVMTPIAHMLDVERIVLGAFSARGRRPASFSIQLTEPEPGSGVVHGVIEGPGGIGVRQELSIRVRPEHEARVLARIRRCVPDTKLRRGW